MSPSSLFRLSGMALVLAAAGFSAAEVIAFSIFVTQGEGYDLHEIARTEAFFIQSLLTLLAGTLLLGGLVGLYLRQSEAAGKIGLTGFLLAFFGTVFVVSGFYTNTFVTPMVALEVPGFLNNPLAGMLQVWLPFSFGILAISWLLVAVATVRAGVYRRGASWFLLFATVVALVPIPLINLPFGAALAWLGLDLLRVRDVAPRGRRRNKSRR